MILQRLVIEGVAENLATDVSTDDDLGVASRAPPLDDYAHAIVLKRTASPIQYALAMFVPGILVYLGTELTPIPRVLSCRLAKIVIQT